MTDANPTNTEGAPWFVALCEWWDDHNMADGCEKPGHVFRMLADVVADALEAENEALRRERDALHTDRDNVESELRAMCENERHQREFAHQMRRERDLLAERVRELEREQDAILALFDDSLYRRTSWDIDRITLGRIQQSIVDARALLRDEKGEGDGE